MKWISGRDYREAFDLLPLELVDLVAEGLPCYSALGERVELRWYGVRVGFTCYGKPVKDRLEFAKRIDIHRFNVDENRVFLQEKHPEMMEYLARKYPPQDPPTTQPTTATTEPGHDQQVEDQEPTDAVPYVKWRRGKVGSIHDGQLMLEVQDRWGRPPKKTLNRAEIAALVLGLDPPTGKTRDSLEDAFKNKTRAYKNMPKT